MDVAVNTLVVYSDLACPWATLCVARLWETRHRLGLEGSVRFDHRAFPLEVFNRRPTPRLILDAEISVVGHLDPGFGFSIWTAAVDTYPVSTLLAMEAVQAAKEQGLAASEALDLALRRALFVHSRCVTMRNVILEAADGCVEVDRHALEKGLDDGRARAAVMRQQAEAGELGVQGSPHVFAPDGTDAHNPGITMHWEGPKPGGFPVVDHDDPSVYDRLLRTVTSAP